MRSILADDRWRGLHDIGRFASEVLDRLDGVHELRTGLRKLHPLDPLWLTIQIERLRPDVFFSPGVNAPLHSHVPFVFTLHDLIHLHEPGERSFSKTVYAWGSTAYPWRFLPRGMFTNPAIPTCYT